MAVGVKTPYWGNFNIPGTCVVCGGPPGAGTKWKVAGSKSDWTGKHTTTLNLEVPLCQGCYDVSRDSWVGKLVSCSGILMALATCVISVALVEDTLLGFGIGLTVMLIVGGLAAWLARLIDTRNLTAEQKTRRGLVKSCAKITGFKMPGLFDKQGWIQFEFQNPAFAAEFAGLNMGQLA